MLDPKLHRTLVWHLLAKYVTYLPIFSLLEGPSAFLTFWNDYTSLKSVLLLA